MHQRRYSDTDAHVYLLENDYVCAYYGYRRYDKSRTVFFGYIIPRVGNRGSDCNSCRIDCYRAYHSTAQIYENAKTNRQGQSDSGR